MSFLTLDVRDKMDGPFRNVAPPLPHIGTDCAAELKEFLDDQQPRFVQEFGELLRLSIEGECYGMRGHLEALWARYSMLLALAERFAARADAAGEEMTKFMHREAHGFNH